MKLEGTIRLPGDKSISHRAIMFSGIATGEAKIYNLLFSADTNATLAIFKQLGVTIEVKEEFVRVIGKGFSGLKQPTDRLDCKNSGTTARLLLGLLSGLSFPVTITGDASLKQRPMLRVVKPLSKLGAEIQLRDGNFLPATIQKATLKHGTIDLEVESAQVKSAVILAALKSKETSTIRELATTRDHTERLLAYLGCDIEQDGLLIKVNGQNDLQARDIHIPGDLSSAAFFIVAALIVKESQITILNCGINRTRSGIFMILDQIEADYEIINQRLVCNEPVGDIMICYTKNLKPFHIKGKLVPLLIDEIPILSLLATQINGVSTIEDAAELRIKETDRIKAVVSELTKLGADITEKSDGLTIRGNTALTAQDVKSYHDHRLSMMLKVARLITPAQFTIENDRCDQISYPNFEVDLLRLLK